ncbi:MAG TPA: glycogen/starch/alpha-glucan phosphorylase [Myxococcota bacterium]|nr:glycogen/starch/alpha-glucan phosphorylase [Myxococcota bacterium]
MTPRRWLKMCNPALSALITQYIGDDWVSQLDNLKKLRPLANDTQFRKQWAHIKRENKENLARLIFAEHEVEVNIDSMFDCHVKRIHEYKRQLLNILRVIHHYNSIKDAPQKGWVPKTIIFSGKAAPGYFMAKRIIKLISGVANVVNHDETIGNLLKVFFLENYRVTLAEKIMPAADLSEQISTAGTEASGTGNMKFALNRALTIGTLDGANIEILQEVGAENIFIFGLKTDEIENLKKKGYQPWEYYYKNPHIKRVLDMLKDGSFSGGDRELYSPIYHSLLDGGDPYCLLADFDSYIAAQGQVDAAYKNQDEWVKKSIYNVAGMGKFSSDRTIQDYAKEIWRL